MQTVYDLDKIEVPSKLLILVRGLPGCGKSLIAKLLTKANGIAISVDDFLTNPQGQYEFSKGNFIAAQEACRQYCRELMTSSSDLIVLHNTFSQAWEAKDYFDMANEFSYSVQVVSLYDNGLNDSDLSKRCIHFMPVHLIQKCRHKWDLDIYPHRQRTNIVESFTLKGQADSKIYLHSKKNINQ
jgi:hypothetical protein